MNFRSTLALRLQRFAAHDEAWVEAPLGSEVFIEPNPAIFRRAPLGVKYPGSSFAPSEFGFNLTKFYKYFAPNGASNNSSLYRTPLPEIPHNLRPDPSAHRHRHPIPNHSVSIVSAPRESESVRNSLPGVFPNRVRP